MDRESGVVKLRQKIDREQQSELEVVISVTGTWKLKLQNKKSIIMC